MKNLRDPSQLDLLKANWRRKMVPKKMMTWRMINKKKPLSNKSLKGANISQPWYPKLLLGLLHLQKPKPMFILLGARNLTR